jgi:hypothetical protein
VAAKGGVEAVVAAMNAHRQSADVQEQGCRALCNISVLSENKVACCSLLKMDFQLCFCSFLTTCQRVYVDEFSLFHESSLWVHLLPCQ